MKDGPAPTTGSTPTPAAPPLLGPPSPPPGPPAPVTVPLAQPKKPGDSFTPTPRPSGPSAGFSPTADATDWGAKVRSGPLAPGMGVPADTTIGLAGPVKESRPAPAPPPLVPTKPGLVRPEGDGAVIGKKLHVTSGGPSVFHKEIPGGGGRPATTVDVTVNPSRGTGMPLHLTDPTGVPADPHSVETIDATKAPNVTGASFEVRF